MQLVFYCCFFMRMIYDGVLLQFFNEGCYRGVDFNVSDIEINYLLSCYRILKFDIQYDVVLFYFDYEIIIL